MRKTRPPASAGQRPATASSGRRPATAFSGETPATAFSGQTPADPPGTADASAMVAERIRRDMERMTPAERKVARTLLAQYPTAGLETVAELAQAAGVSNPTVVRLVAKLGYAGYPDFQAALRREISQRFRSPLSLYDRAATLAPDGESLAATLDSFIDGLRSTFSSLSAGELAAAVALLADPRKRILCLGGRYSRILAAALQADLHHLRANTRLIGNDDPGLAGALLDIGRGDVLVVFDFRRYQADVVRAARFAAEQGAKVILVTDPWLSPAADCADHVLTVSVEGLSPLGSMVGGLALVETIVLGLLARFGDAPRARLERFDILQAGAVLEGPRPGGPAWAAIAAGDPPGGPAPARKRRSGGESEQGGMR